MLKRLNNDKCATLPWFTLLAGAVAFLLYFIPQSWAEALQFSRSSFQQGAVWQIFSGHLLHWNFEHLFTDIAVFAGIGVIVERRSRILFTSVFFLSALLISLSVYVFNPDIENYRGLSGIDMALASVWIIDSLIRSVRAGNRFEVALWSIGLLGVLLKPVIEIVIGHPIFVQDLGSNVVGLPIPHIMGAIVGICLCVISFIVSIDCSSEEKFLQA